MQAPTTHIRIENGTWILLFNAPGATKQEFTCASEDMAKQLESVLLRSSRRSHPRGRTS